MCALFALAQTLSKDPLAGGKPPSLNRILWTGAERKISLTNKKGRRRNGSCKANVKGHLSQLKESNLFISFLVP
jgi:hypothetical protein